ncbi:hypothetical protein QQ020_32890 [Fulvivirgaceae bacterium BMA12]|uniref:Uncharacterized protein n=1 Tax=Agaribacillus aureus TaxID=3051825 RepID=A0ABT8LGI7_9BACT|nr:hypothetical protein [Fulvivirgaceae bacterium BMA12]
MLSESDKIRLVKNILTLDKGKYDNVSRAFRNRLKKAIEKKLSADPGKSAKFEYGQQNGLAEELANRLFDFLPEKEKLEKGLADFLAEGQKLNELGAKFIPGQMWIRDNFFVNREGDFKRPVIRPKKQMLQYLCIYLFEKMIPENEICAGPEHYTYIQPDFERKPYVDNLLEGLENNIFMDGLHFVGVLFDDDLKFYKEIIDPAVSSVFQIHNSKNQIDFIRDIVKAEEKPFSNATFVENIKTVSKYVHLENGFVSLRWISNKILIIGGARGSEYSISESRFNTVVSIVKKCLEV